MPDVDRRRAAAIYPRLEATYAALGRPREFEEQMRALLEERPADAEARLALARALAARGEAEPALAEVRAVLEREPENPKAHTALARVLLAEGREAEAAKAFAEFLDLLERRGSLEPREPLA